MEVWVRGCGARLVSAALPPGSSCLHLKLCLCRQGIPAADVYLKCNGKLVGEEVELQDGATYSLEPRLVGGKGGSEGRRKRKKPTRMREVITEIRGLLHEIDRDNLERDCLRQERQAEREERVLRAHYEAETQAREADRQERERNMDKFTNMISNFQQEMQTQSRLMRDLIGMLGSPVHHLPPPFALLPPLSTILPPQWTKDPYSNTTLLPPPLQYYSSPASGEDSPTHSEEGYKSFDPPCSFSFLQLEDNH